MLNKTTESVNPTDKKEESKPVKLGDKEITRLEQRQPQHKIVAERERQKLEEARKKLEEARKKLEEIEKRLEEAEKLEAEEREEELFKIMEYKAEKLGIEESEADELKIKQQEEGRFEIEDLQQPSKRHNFAITRESYSSAIPSINVSFSNSDEGISLEARRKILNKNFFEESDFLIKKPETLKEQPENLEEMLGINQEACSNRPPKNE